MRTPRMRFTVKRLMLAVVLLALLLSGVKTYRGWMFSRLAAYHARERRQNGNEKQRAGQQPDLSLITTAE